MDAGEHRAPRKRYRLPNRGHAWRIDSLRRQEKIQLGNPLLCREELETDTPAGTQDPNPGDYDPGTGSLVSTDSGKWYIHVLYITRLGEYVLAYAQQEFDSELAADTSLVTGSPFVESPTLEVMVPRAFLILKGSATDFSSPSDAKILLAPKFRLTNDQLKV